MGIDYIINHGCVPKELLTTPGLLERLKAGERAEAIIHFYRQNGDQRPIDEMGGEVMRRAADGEEEVQTVLVKDLLALQSELKGLESHCIGCPANHANRAFGCIGHVNYPISQQAEVWLLAQLPTPDEPLPFLLLTKAEEFGFTGDTARSLRENSPGVIFESVDTFERRYPEMNISTDQLFELFFLLGDRIPVKRIVMTLLFLHAINRDLEAHELMGLTPATPDAVQKTPFLLKITPDDDRSTRDLKSFLYGLYVAYTQDREVLLDV